MKKVYKIIALLLVTVFFAGCAANADVILENSIPSNEDNIIGELLPITPAPIEKPEYDFTVKTGYMYENVDELLGKLQARAFNDEFIKELENANSFRKNESNISISSINQDNFYIVTAPSGVEIDEKIEYTVIGTIQREDSIDIARSGMFIWYYNDSYNAENAPTNLDEAFGYSMNSLYDGEPIGTVTKNGVTAYKYVRNDPTWTHNETYIYELTDGSKTVYVREYYILASAVESFFVSEYPAYVEMIIVDGNKHYSIQACEFTEMPTAEWLLSFGLQKYQNDVVTE